LSQYGPLLKFFIHNMNSNVALFPYIASPRRLDKLQRTLEVMNNVF
jgi:hypothetical protein